MAGSIVDGTAPEAPSSDGRVVPADSLTFAGRTVATRHEPAAGPSASRCASSSRIDGSASWRLRPWPWASASTPRCSRWLDAVLIRGLPFPEADRLYVLGVKRQTSTGGGEPISRPDLLDRRASTTGPAAASPRIDTRERRAHVAGGDARRLDRHCERFRPAAPADALRPQLPARRRQPGAERVVSSATPSGSRVPRRSRACPACPSASTASRGRSSA